MKHNFISFDSLLIFTSADILTHQPPLITHILLGLWPAFWLLSEYLCWPVGTEFDIMEAIGDKHNMYDFSISLLILHLLCILFYLV